MGLLEALKNDKVLSEEKNVWAIGLFDHEEVGSQSDHGAASPLVNDLVRRVTTSADLFERAIRRSFVVSADMAHAVHPNYAGKHDPLHKPQIHKGTVIKTNVNQRYATSGVTATVLREIAKRNSIPVQDFSAKNDSPCGTTIGPIISGNTGIRTVDIGNPQLSMHSIREMCGTSDVTHAINLLKSFFCDFTTLDEQFEVD